MTGSGLTGGAGGAGTRPSARTATVWSGVPAPHHRRQDGAALPVKVGITLPQFRDEADSALDAARRAEDAGHRRVFCFDHLWPMGQPGRPALSSGPLLGALVASTSTISVGTLVARIGLAARRRAGGRPVEPGRR